MKIIRIEHKTKKTGVYTTVGRPPELSDKIWSEFTFGERHPTPERDSLFVENLRLRYPKKFTKEFGDIDAFCSMSAFKFLKYGFDSIKQLRAWFCSDEIFVLMNNHNYHIVEIEVEDVIIGHTQVAYDTNDEILSQTEHDILDYLNIK